jgi:hypothetical protein
MGRINMLKHDGAAYAAMKRRIDSIIKQRTLRREIKVDHVSKNKIQVSVCCVF